MTTIETLKLEGNKKLTLDKLKKLKIAVTTINQSKIECHTVASGQDEWIEKVEDFWHCTVIKGKLMLKGLQTNIKEGEVSLKEVDGCLTIEKTKFTNLDFLKNVPINCIRDKNHLLDNEELCPPTWLKNVATFGKNKEIGCGRSSDTCLTTPLARLTLPLSLARVMLQMDSIFRGNLHGFKSRKLHHFYWKFDHQQQHCGRRAEGLGDYSGKSDNGGHDPRSIGPS